MEVNFKSIKIKAEFVWNEKRPICSLIQAIEAEKGRFIYKMLIFVQQIKLHITTSQQGGPSMYKTSKKP